MYLWNTSRASLFPAILPSLPEHEANTHIPPMPALLNLEMGDSGNATTLTAGGLINGVAAKAGTSTISDSSTAFPPTLPFPRVPCPGWHDSYIMQ